MVYEDEYDGIVQGLEQKFGYGQEILDWLSEKMLLDFIVIEGKDPKERLVNYLD